MSRRHPPVKQDERDQQTSRNSPTSKRAPHQIVQLQNIVGNRAIQRMLADGTLQRDEDDNFQLEQPDFGSSLSNPANFGLGVGALTLDPFIQAEIDAIQRANQILNPDFLGEKLSTLDLTLSPAQMQEILNPQGSQSQLPPDFFGPMPQQRNPFPRGAGPEESRAGKPKDILKAILKLPDVDRAITNVRNQVTAQLARGWNNTSGAERTLIITHSIVMSGMLVPAVIANPSLLSPIENREIPIPETPVTIKFNLSGENQSFMIGVDVGQLLPESLGFNHD